MLLTEGCVALLFVKLLVEFSSAIFRIWFLRSNTYIGICVTSSIKQNAQMNIFQSVFLIHSPELTKSYKIEEASFSSQQHRDPDTMDRSIFRP